MLRQHHQALLQKCGIMTKHDSQTLRRKKDACMPYMQDTVLRIANLADFR